MHRLKRLLLVHYLLHIPAVVLHLRNAATLTLVERECFLESAEQA